VIVFAIFSAGQSVTYRVGFQIKLDEMIRASATADGPIMTLNASVDGPVVYLDNWAIGDLAEGDSSRRARFINAMHSGVDLLFSVTNAAELSGPQGRSAEAVRTFLDEIGPRWFPVELNVMEVVEREMKGVDPNGVCIAELFLKSYVAELMRRYTPGLGKVINLSDDFFRLGGILDYVGPQRESIRKGSEEMDKLLRNKFNNAAFKCKGETGLLDRRFPRIPFHPSRPACFVLMNLLRTMVEEARTFKPGDGMDFCHAVMASAFASFATLDKHWKRRVAGPPTPNQLARISGASELDQMVTDMESWLAHRVAS
jgi:hypothetical protein